MVLWQPLFSITPLAMAAQGWCSIVTFLLPGEYSPEMQYNPPTQHTLAP